MTGITDRVFLQELLQHSETAVLEMRITIRGLQFLFENAERPQLQFRDRDMSVTWRDGGFQYQKGADAPYKLLKFLYQAGDEGLSYAELAEKVYGDDLADVRRCAYGVAAKLEKFRCPKRLAWDSERLWLEDT